MYNYCGGMTMYKNILFDVDGTLLPMDVHEFVKYYFGSLCEKMIPVLKIEPKALTDSIMAGLGAMAKTMVPHLTEMCSGKPPQK
jgi:hypothetical protein